MASDAFLMLQESDIKKQKLYLDHGIVAAMNLKESARKCLLHLLPYDRSDTSLATHLNGLDVRELLVVYHNWASRLVEKRARTAHLSATLQRKLPGSGHRLAIEQIIEDIEQGRELNKYLSRDVRIATQLPDNSKKYNRRRDLDLMLMSWQMHHMHLSTNLEHDGFVSRTDDLLFLVLRKDDAYLVDIMPHGSWSRDHLMQVCLDELPGAQAVHVLQGVIGVSRNYTEEEHQKLRNAGINTVRMIGDRAVIPAGLITGAGTSYRASRDADQAISLLEGFEASWADHPDEIRELCRENGTELPEEPDFVFTITDGLGAGVLERRSKAFFPFPLG